MSEQPALADVIATLQRILLNIAPQLDDLLGPALTGDDSIRRLGLSSGEMLAFLVAVEDQFDMTWEDDLSPTVLTSFEAMAAHVAAQCGVQGPAA